MNRYAQTSEKIALSKLFGGMAYPLLSLLKIPAACRCSDSGDNLDPGLVHRLETLGFHLRILVWDGADEVVALAVLVDLARVSLVALINWTYLSRKVDLGSANDHGKSAGSDRPHHSISRYNLITAYP